MKNNQSSPEQHRSLVLLREINPAILAMAKMREKLKLARAQVSEAADLLRLRHDLRKEPNNLGLHMQVDELLQKMIADFETMIGRHYANLLIKAKGNE